MDLITYFIDNNLLLTFFIYCFLFLFFDCLFQIFIQKKKKGLENMEFDIYLQDPKFGLNC